MRVVKRIIFMFALLAVVLASTSCFTYIRGELWTKTHPDTTRYHTYGEIVVDLHKLAADHPDIAQLHSIGKTYENRDIWAISISVKAPEGSPPKPDILVIGGQHANEWIGKEVVLYYAERFIAESETDPLSKALLSRANIWLIPCANPDGAIYSETVDRQWRKNRRAFGGDNYGFDVNRAYPYMWRVPGNVWNNPPAIGGSDDPSSQHFRGYPDYDDPNKPARITNEVLAILSLVSDPQRNFILFLDYHSFSELVLYPPAFSKENAPDEQQYLQLSEGMAKAINDTSLTLGRRADLNEPKGPLKYRAKNAGRLYPEIVTGGSIDTMYYEYGIWSLGIELPPYQGTFLRMVGLYAIGKGFLLPAGRIKSVCIENVAGFLYACAWALDHPAPKTRATAPRPAYTFDSK
jgi:carboxypeptidase T